MKKVGAFLVLAIAALALVACGGGSSNSSSSTTETSGGESQAEQGGAAKEESSSGGGGSGSTLKFEADPKGELAYTTTHATAKAGKVTVEFNNPQSLTHDVAFESSDGKLVGETKLIDDSSDTTTLNFKPGTYTFYCSVPGHREAGMEGTLIVR
jgi:plastocyanin